MSKACCPLCGQKIKPPPKKRSWTPSEDAILHEGLAAGRSHAAVAAMVGRTASSVGSRLLTLERRANAGKPGNAMGDAAPHLDDEPEAMPQMTIDQRPGVRIITHRIAG